MNLPQLSIVVPCYNEEEVLPETVRRLSSLLTELLHSGRVKEGSHVLFVDDGSGDSTWALIEEYSESNRFISGLKLSRNRGHQNALLAGLTHARGDIVVSVDADLQDDLNAVIAMVDAHSKGYDVVYGVRESRSTDSFFKRFTAECYYRILAWMGVELVFNHADYRLLSRRALEALKAHEEVNLFLRGVVPTLGFPSTQVTYDRAERFAGESKYPLRKMLSLALDGLTSFSVFPLRMISAMGILVCLVSFTLSVWALGIRLFADYSTPGWASSVIPIYFLGGVQLLSLGVLGEYMGKVYREVKRRPRYFVEKHVTHTSSLKTASLRLTRWNWRKKSMQGLPRQELLNVQRKNS